MSVHFLKSYSTKAYGYVRHQPGKVSVLVPRAQDQMDLFASQKQNDRLAVLDKLETSILREQLSTTNRNKVFRGSSLTKWNSSEDSQSKFTMVLGNVEKQVDLTPRKYLGPPSRQDLRTAIFTSRTSDDVKHSLNLIQQCLRSKELSKNFDQDMLPALLRRAANAGVYQDIYQHLTTSRAEFARHLKQPFFLEALRLYALRIPYLSHRSKSVLSKLWTRAGTGASRDFCYAFGLAQFQKKFGDEHQGRLGDALKSIESFIELMEEKPRRFYKVISLTDLVMGYEAIHISGVPGKEKLLKTFENILLNLSRNRPLQESLMVDLGDREQDGFVEENLSEKAEE